MVDSQRNSSVMAISFSGVDGAGKTTLLRRFVELLENEGRRCVELRHRPSLLPILSSVRYGKRQAERLAQNSLPRKGQNRSRLSSYLRFAYYLADYLLGQWVVYFRFTRNGIVVVYDRYYFDFIVDSRRSNIDIPPGLVRFFYRFVFKPDMNVLLYADTASILARKAELSASEIEHLTLGYKRLFLDLAERNPGQYVTIENDNVESTLEQVQDIYMRLGACSNV